VTRENVRCLSGIEPPPGLLAGMGSNGYVPHPGGLCKPVDSSLAKPPGEVIQPIIEIDYLKKAVVRGA
jgi:hypothetical protein